VASLPLVDLSAIQVSAAPSLARVPRIWASSVATSAREAVQPYRWPGITSMSSKSSLGVTSIRLTFDMSRDVDGAARECRSGNQRGSQLSALKPSPRIPTYRKIDSARAPVLVLNLASKTASSGVPLRQAPSSHHPAKNLSSQRRWPSNDSWRVLTRCARSI